MLNRLKEKVYERNLGSDCCIVGGNRSLFPSWIMNVNWIFTVSQDLSIKWAEYGTSCVLTIKQVKLQEWQRCRRINGHQNIWKEKCVWFPHSTNKNDCIYMICPKSSTSSICFSLYCPEGSHSSIQSKRLWSKYTVHFSWSNNCLIFPRQSNYCCLLMWTNWRKFLKEKCNRKGAEERGKEDWEKVAFGEPQLPQRHESCFISAGHCPGGH